MKTTFEKITPALAAIYLTRIAPYQRDLRASGVAKWVRILTTGQYKPTTNGIAFDTQDLLFDGQHRLHAVVKTGITIMANIHRDCDPETFLVMDQGQRRTLGDFTGDSEKSAIVTAIAKIITGTSVSVTKPDYDVIYKLFGHSVDLVLKDRSHERGLGRAGFLGSISLCASGFGEQAFEFHRSVITGALLQPDSPALRLRNQLIVTLNNGATKSGRKLNEILDMARAVSQCFISYIRGETRKQVRASCDKSLIEVLDAQHEKVNKVIEHFEL